MKKETRVEIVKQTTTSIAKSIALWGGDPWPDHLWPQAYEVCEEICKRLGVEDPYCLAIDSIEEDMSERGVDIRDVYEGERPIHKAYQSLYQMYTDLLNEHDQLRKELERLMAQNGLHRVR